MSELLWWAIFVVPTLAAVVWALWRAYPTRPGNTFHSVAAHHRFVEALARTERKAHDEPEPKLEPKAERGLRHRPDRAGPRDAGGGGAAGADGQQHDRR